MVAATKRLLPYVLRHRRRLLLGLSCVVAMASVSLLSPWVLKYAIDDLTVGVTRGKLGLYGALLLGIAVVGGCFRFLMRRLIVGVSREIEYDIRNDFYAHLERLSLSYFQSERTGDIMSRATNDLSAVRMMAGPAIMYSVNTILVFFVAIILMLSINLRLTLIALIPLPFVSLLVKFFGSAIHRRFEEIQAQLSHMSAVVQEALAGVRVVRAYRQEESEIERFRVANRTYLDRNRGLIQLQGLFYPSLAMFLGFGGLLVLWLGSREVILGQITVGEFVAFNAYLVMLTWPMIAFGWVTNMLQRGMASWKRMLEVFDAVPEIIDRGGVPVGNVQGGIEIRELTFAYGDGAPVLSSLSLRVEPGQTLALVGGTGSGKSTLLGLIQRLYDPPPGTVFIDGIDVRDLPLGQLRSAVGYVPQEPFLFSTTLRDNVAFGLAEDANTDVVDKSVRTAITVACLDADIEQFPRGYETTVGERGITLSGGQKQRVALARALTVDPRILILDDALSAVDTYTEERILKGLREVMDQRTSIIVAHRMSTVRDADIIAVLDQGRLVEQGTHDELLDLNDVYADLYRKQLLEEELAAS
ncbi:MAG: ABC transporter ATP-binding protein [Vicinamibacterales bacterium]|nr:multidrug ABC transporter ATP-binding protein [Acidobacteriota bacterium]MDP7210318.1 ABC transporter ATP-binding protein [Vicinamibacterales bacterium]HJO18672.1 ABC transporter ATP-binding protein [Vicinamibacterales bacterium]